MNYPMILQLLMVQRMHLSKTVRLHPVSYLFFFPMPLDRVKSFVLNYTCVLFESNIGLLLCLCSLNWTFSIAIIANIIVAVAQPIQFTIVPPSCFILGFLRSPVCDRLILQQALRSLGSISLYLASSGPF